VAIAATNPTMSMSGSSEVWVPEAAALDAGMTGVDGLIVTAAFDRGADAAIGLRGAGAAARAEGMRVTGSGQAADLPGRRVRRRGRA
jgi:hypothetical protein